MIESQSSFNDFSFVYLRSINFHFLHSSLKQFERVSIMSKIFNVSPNVTHLTVLWPDFDCCSRILNNLKHIQLILDYSPIIDRDRDPFDIHRLFQLTPNLLHLQTSTGNIYPDEKLIEFIWRIINQFHRLINLTINKNSLYSSKGEKKLRFTQLFIAHADNQDYHSKRIHIDFHINDEISVCL